VDIYGLENASFRIGKMGAAPSAGGEVEEAERRFIPVWSKAAKRHGGVALGLQRWLHHGLVCSVGRRKKTIHWAGLGQCALLGSNG
jgi:hypothetical protein